MGNKALVWYFTGKDGEEKAVEFVEITEINRKTGEPTGIRFRHEPDSRYFAKVPQKYYGSMPRGDDSLEEELKVISTGHSPRRYLLGCKATRVKGAIVYECELMFVGKAPFILLRRYADGWQVWEAKQQLKLDEISSRSEALTTCRFCGRLMVSLWRLVELTGQSASELTKKYGKLRRPDGGSYTAGWSQGGRDITVSLEGDPLPPPELDGDGMEVWVDPEWAKTVTLLDQFKGRRLREAYPNF